MNAIFDAAFEVERVCRRAGFRSCFIGGVAVQRWGEARMTADVDLTLITGFGTEEPYVDAILAHLKPRISEARAFALQHRTLLVAASNGVHADIALGAMPFEERTVDRASAFSIGEGREITTCSAEDLVVHKAFAARDKDWLDIAGIVTRRGPRLDRALIWSELGPLLVLRDDPSIEPRLRRLLGG